MEIAPIPGIRAITAVKAQPAETRLTAVFDMEAIVRAGDDSYTGDGHTSSGGQDDDAEDTLSTAPDETGQRRGGAEENPPHRVSLFA